MKEFDYSGDAKVMGTVCGAFLSAFGPYEKRGQQVLCKHFKVDQVDLTENGWYPLTDFLSAMKEFQKQFGIKFMQKIGQGIFANAVFPPEIEDVEGGLSMIHQAYYMNHNVEPDEIGGYYWTTQGEQSGIMVCDNPYPCAFDLGIIETIAGNFAPEAKVVHSDDKPCRHKGGDSCTYIIEW